MKAPWSAITNFLNQDRNSSKEVKLDIKDDPKAGLKMIFAKTSPLGKILEEKGTDQPWYNEKSKPQNENFWEEAYKKGKLSWISNFTEEDLKKIEITEFHKELCNLNVNPWVSLDIISECKEAKKSPLGKILVDLKLDKRIPYFFAEGLLELKAEELKHINHDILKTLGIHKPKDQILILSRCEKASSKKEKPTQEMTLS
jgi:hypothetical protein